MFIDFKWFDDNELKKRGYNFFITLYPDSTDYETDRILSFIRIQADKGEDFLKEYAYILHDKDDDIKPHYHIALKFSQAKTIKSFLKTYMLYNYNPNQNDIIVKKEKWYGVLQYLIHNTKDSKDKYQYSEESVISNIPGTILGLRIQKDKVDIFNDICDFINDTENYPITHKKVIAYCRSMDREYLKCYMNRSNNFIFSNLIKENTF